MKKSEKADWSNIVNKNVVKKLDFSTGVLTKAAVNIDYKVFTHPVDCRKRDIRGNLVMPLDENRIKYYSEEEMERDWVEELEYDEEY
tara:strand:+ start:394 stop:654 length:261 start_codon:yes stop_codon:yes gene_type:complete